MYQRMVNSMLEIIQFLSAFILVIILTIIIAVLFFILAVICVYICSVFMGKENAITKWVNKKTDDEHYLY